MKKILSQIPQGVKNLSAFFVAFILPILFFTVIVVDAHWFLPFVVCPAFMVAAAFISQGHKGISSWIKWAAVIGVVYAAMIVFLN